MEPVATATAEPTIVKILRWTGVVEGISFLVLVLVAMPLKYFFDSPQMVRTVGMAHGWLFLAYVALAMYAAITVRWSFMKWLWITAASLIPIGTFITDRQLKREYQTSTPDQVKSRAA